MLYKKGDKLQSTPYFTAKNFLELKKINFKIPENIILIPIAGINSYLKSASKKHYNLFGGIDIISDNAAVVSNFGMGAPMAAMMIEVLICLGAKNFVLLGIAGGLNKDLKIGDTVICTGALCDDGTSKDYINEESVESDKTLTALIKDNLPHQSEGYTWTTDSIFRETVAEIAFYQKQNIQTVEMEAAALFAICKAKGLKSAGVFVISDLLTGDKWEPSFFDKNIYDNLIENIKKIAGLF